MSEINPANPKCLTDKDVDYSLFSCCGDEDLVFLRCESCGHIWVECFECSTWYVDLGQLELKESSLLTSDDHRNACPKCANPFAELYYLADENCHRYLPTKQQVMAAGLSRFLADQTGTNQDDSQRSKANQSGVSRPGSKKSAAPLVDRGATWMALAGGVLGSMGWILGLAISLAVQGDIVDAAFSGFCSLGVALLGVWIWNQKKAGRPVTYWFMFVSLLFASMIFGLCACLWCNRNGTLETVIDPEGKLPAIANFAAPLILLAMIGIFFIPAIRRRLSQYRL